MKKNSCAFFKKSLLVHSFSFFLIAADPQNSGETAALQPQLVAGDASKQVSLQEVVSQQKPGQLKPDLQLVVSNPSPYIQKVQEDTGLTIVEGDLLKIDESKFTPCKLTGSVTPLAMLLIKDDTLSKFSSMSDLTKLSAYSFYRDLLDGKEAKTAIKNFYELQNTTFQKDPKGKRTKYTLGGQQVTTIYTVEKDNNKIVNTLQKQNQVTQQMTVEGSELATARGSELIWNFILAKSLTTQMHGMGSVYATKEGFVSNQAFTGLLSRNLGIMSMQSVPTQMHTEKRYMGAHHAIATLAKDKVRFEELEQEFKKIIEDLFTMKTHYNLQQRKIFDIPLAKSLLCKQVAGTDLEMYMKQVDKQNIGVGDLLQMLSDVKLTLTEQTGILSFLEGKIKKYLQSQPQYLDDVVNVAVDQKGDHFITGNEVCQLYTNLTEKAYKNDKKDGFPAFFYDNDRQTDLLVESLLKWEKSVYDFSKKMSDLYKDYSLQHTLIQTFSDAYDKKQQAIEAAFEVKGKNTVKNYFGLRHWHSLFGTTVYDKLLKNALSIFTATIIPTKFLLKGEFTTPCLLRSNKKNQMTIIEYNDFSQIASQGVSFKLGLKTGGGAGMSLNTIITGINNTGKTQFAKAVCKTSAIVALYGISPTSKHSPILLQSHIISPIEQMGLLSDFGYSGNTGDRVFDELLNYLLQNVKKSKKKILIFTDEYGSKTSAAVAEENLNELVKKVGGQLADIIIDEDAGCVLFIVTGQQPGFSSIHYPETVSQLEGTVKLIGKTPVGIKNTMKGCVTSLSSSDFTTKEYEFPIADKEEVLRAVKKFQAGFYGIYQCKPKLPSPFSYEIVNIEEDQTQFMEKNQLCFVSGSRTQDLTAIEPSSTYVKEDTAKGTITICITPQLRFFPTGAFCCPALTVTKNNGKILISVDQDRTLLAKNPSTDIDIETEFKLTAVKQPADSFGAQCQSVNNSLNTTLLVEQLANAITQYELDNPNLNTNEAAGRKFTDEAILGLLGKMKAISNKTAFLNSVVLKFNANNVKKSLLKNVSDKSDGPIFCLSEKIFSDAYMKQE